MTAIRWMLHNLRRALGIHQLTTAFEATASQVGKLEASLRKILPPPAQRGNVLVELNGDRLLLPPDLLKFWIHTRVSAPDAEVPQLLAETGHYLWVRDRLQIGDTALDVGANIGLFTVMMARKVRYGQAGVVHSFEPSPGMFRDLRRVIAANEISNVVTAQIAASDSCGRAVFVDIQAENVTREASHLEAAGETSQQGTNRVEVETITLDRYVAGHQMRPRLIKIDVEGAEFLVLEGAREVIGSCHPLLVIEIHPDSNGVFDHARLRRYLDEYGYRYDHQDKTYYCE